MSKLRYDDIEDFISEQGHRLVSFDYEGCYAPLQVECPNGHTYEVSWSNFKLGKRCPECAKQNKYHSIEYIRTEVAKEEDTLLSSSYKGYSDTLTIVCKCGNVYTKTWTAYQQKNRCIICKHMLKLEKQFKDRYERGIAENKTFESWYEYNFKARQLSEHNYSLFKELLNPDNLKRSLTDYHIDHVLSLSEGYKKGISIEEIAHPANLQLIHWKENLKKGKKSEQTYKDLSKKIKEWIV